MVASQGSLVSRNTFIVAFESVINLSFPLLLSLLLRFVPDRIERE